MNDEHIEVAIERLHPQPMFKTWQWAIGWIVVLCIVTTMILVTVNVIQQRNAQFKSSDAECARQVLSDYEDRRDNILRAINNPAAFAKAIQALNDFELHGGRYETRSERTTRICSS